ncbi:hypothetical protein SLA2020_322760 [Shorea laevis]
MAGINYFLCVTILCTTLLSSSGSCYAQSKEEQKNKLLFVFGDSLFDPGNNQYLNSSRRSPATSWPYGMGMNNHSTGRLSDGLIVPDFIALFAKLHVLPPVLQPDVNFSDGANFASAGGGVLDTHIGVMNMGTQLNNFKRVVNMLTKKYGEEETKKILMRSVFLFSLGGNDYFAFNTEYPNSTQAERMAYMRLVVGNLTNGLKEIYAMGGRKIAFQNVGPLGCVPTIKMMYPEFNGSCVRNFMVHAKLHNKALSNALKKLSTELPGFKYSIFDYYTALEDRIKNPTKYGFKEGYVACCGSGLYNGRNCGGGDDGKQAYNLCSNPSQYVFFDGGHTTEKTNHQLANLIWSGIPNVTGPYNVKQLFEFP